VDYYPGRRRARRTVAQLGVGGERVRDETIPSLSRADGSMEEAAQGTQTMDNVRTGPFVRSFGHDDPAPSEGGGR
jgi:hypothetical protein